MQVKASLACRTLLTSAFLAAFVGLPRNTGAGNCSLTDDGVTLRVENDFFRLTLRPERGGTSLDFFYKPTGKQFIPPVEALPLFADTATEVGWRGVWVGNPYDYDVLVNTPEQVSVHLQGEDGSTFPFVYMHKTITVRHDRCVIEVDHAVEVDANNMVPVYISPWWHNGLAVVGEHTQYVTPVPSGLARCWDVECLNKWMNHPDVTRPWTALVGKSGTGLGIELTDYKHLETIWQSFYQREWCLEWRFNRVKINNGEKLRTKFWLVPFHGMTGVDGVGGQTIGYITCPDELPDAAPIESVLELCSGETRAVDIRLTAHAVPDGEPVVLLETRADLQAGAVQRSAFTFAPRKQGTFVLRCVLTTGGNTLCDFEKPVIVGEAGAEYAMEPAGERLPPEIMEREPMKLSEEVVTPHVKWAKPYHGGAVRALFVMELLGVRDIIELAQRMDLDYTAVKMSNSNSILRYYGGPDGYGPPTLLECNDCLTTALKDDYDVIVISVIRWDRISATNRKLLLGKSQAGTALIGIDPPTIPKELEELLGVRGGKGRPAFSTPVLRGRHFLTDALPVAALFPTPCRRFEVVAEADVPLTSADGAPVLVARDGATRTIALLYTANSSWGGSLIPNWHGSYQRTWPEYDYGVRYHYWEYFYNLLARCLIWAARKEPHVAVMPPDAPDIALADGPGAAAVSVAIESAAGEPWDAVGELTVRDENHDVRHSARQNVRLNGQATRITFELPDTLGNGLHFADFRLLDAQKQVVNWSSSAFHVQAPARIRSCAMNARIFEHGQPMEAEVELEGIPPEPLRVEADVTDCYSRIVWREARALRPGEAAFDGATHLHFGPEFVPVANWHRFEVRLLQGRHLLQKQGCEFLVFPRMSEPPDWNDYVLSRTFPARISGYHFMDLYNRQLAALGYEKVDVWEHGFARKPHDRDVALDFFQSGVKRLGVVCPTNIAGGGAEYREAIDAYKKAYKQTGDKMTLCRVPCLDDPEFWEAELGQTRAVLQTLIPFRTETFYFGDENTLTRQGNHGDCCYSEHSLRSFRQWLQSEYARLNALNAEWETDFASWDAVVPMTRSEVRNRGNYAPWADHRTYMEAVWAAAYCQYQSTVHDLAPYSCYIGNGGSQAVQADNGLDFWKFFRVWEQAQARLATTWYGKLYRSLPDAPIVTPYGAIGWDRRDDEARYKVWKHAFELRGAGDSAYPSIKKVGPDLSISRSGRSCEQITRPLRQGVGKLLRHLDIVRDGVAIHYSQPSIHGESIIGHAERITQSQSAWVHLLRDLGLDPTYLAYAQVEAGELTAGGYKLFIMPFSVAVSTDEAEQIKAFVEKGGVVIGDAMTGIMDDHCKPWNPSPLDALFGLRRDAEPERRSGKVLIPARGVFAGLERGVVLTTSFTETHLSPTTAKAAARFASGHSGLLINSVGKGSVVRLGFLLSDYPDTVRYDAHRRAQTLDVVRSLLALAGVTRQVVVSGEDGNPLPFCEVWRFRRGDIDYVGVLREHDTRAELLEAHVSIQFPVTRHVYDILGQRYVGHTDRVETVLAPASPAFFALLPEQVQSVQLQLTPVLHQPYSKAASRKVAGASRSGSGGETPPPLYDGRQIRMTPPELTRGGRTPVLDLRYAIETVSKEGRAQDHVLRLEASGPDGKVRGFYSANVFARNGKAEGALRLALNDPVGEWTVRVRDIATGLSTEATFIVR